MTPSVDSTPAASDDRVPWTRLSCCAAVYTGPTALVVAPALADARVLAATGWAPAALTLASSLMFVASAPGAIMGSSAADKVGRRPVAFWTSVGVGLCLAVAAAAPATHGGQVLYVVLRVAGGFVSGGTAPAAFSWAMELTPPRARTRATTALNVLWVAAALVARAVVPESPEFLAARAAPPTQRELDVYGLVEHLDPDVVAADAPSAPLPEAAPKDPLARLWRDHRRPLFPLILSWACVSAAYYGLAYSAGALSKRVVLNFVLLNLADVPGYFAAGRLTTSWGAEPVMVLFSCLAMLSLVLVALGAPALVGIFGKFCTAGMFQQVYAMTTERFPAPVRASAFGVCRVAAMLATFFAPPLARAAARDPAAFLAFALMAGVAAACALALRRSPGG